MNFYHTIPFENQVSRVCREHGRKRNSTEERLFEDNTRLHCRFERRSAPFFCQFQDMISHYVEKVYLVLSGLKTGITHKRDKKLRRHQQRKTNTRNKTSARLFGTPRRAARDGQPSPTKCTLQPAPRIQRGY